jgi:hypothetical protein
MVPKPSQPKARAVLKQIRKNSDIVSFDSKNILYLNNHPIEGSNFHDLFLGLFRKKSKNPNAENPFHHALRDLNVSSSLVVNENYHSGGDNFESPPQSPHIQSTSSSSHSSHPVKKPRSRESSSSRMGTRSSQSGSGPPGKAPKVFRVYSANKK